jgi:IclR family pca regulon transcriptional regulator
VTDPSVLRARLDEVRAQGWSYVKGEIEKGVSSVSVPLADKAGRVIAALNVSTNAERA